MSALFDFPSLIVVLLLFICAATFTRSLYPTIFDTIPNGQNAANDSNSILGMASSESSTKQEHVGLRGFCWKASRIGERLSPYVAVFCVVMAFHILFIKV
jgi:hypothetical protein